MVLQMPRPFKHPKTGVYYFRVRVPVDLVIQFGKKEIKVSLRTKDPSLAKQLFSEREREFEARCKAFRAKPDVLPHRQIVALAGKLYLKFMAPLEDEPGEPEHWRRVLEIGEAVYANEDKMERWYGPAIDELLQREGLSIDGSSRSRLLHEGHTALKQAAEQQLNRPSGDACGADDFSRSSTLAVKTFNAFTANLRRLRFTGRRQERVANTFLA